MKLFRFPDSFLGAPSPRILIIHATLADVLDVERFVEESPKEGSVLLATIDDCSREAIEWKEFALATADFIGLVLSESHVSILEAGMNMHLPNITILGELSPALRQHYRNLGGTIDEERKNVMPFLREIEDHMK